MTTNPTTLAARLREIPHHDIADRKVRDEAAALIEQQQQADNAELATRLRAAEAWRTEVDAWLVNWLMVASDDPKESIQRLVQAEVQVALDPAVSEFAAELRDTYKARAEAAEALVLEQYEDTLLHHSYEHTNPKYAGWMYHSRMSDQEEALAVLVKAGLYELHPEKNALFRRTPTPTPATGQEKTR